MAKVEWHHGELFPRVDFTAEMIADDEGISESEARLAARERLTRLKRWR